MVDVWSLVLTHDRPCSGGLLLYFGSVSIRLHLSITVHRIRSSLDGAIPSYVRVHSGYCCFRIIPEVVNILTAPFRVRDTHGVFSLESVGEKDQTAESAIALTSLFESGCSVYHIVEERGEMAR